MTVDILSVQLFCLWVFLVWRVMFLLRTPPTCVFYLTSFALSLFFSRASLPSSLSAENTPYPTLPYPTPVGGGAPCARCVCAGPTRKVKLGLSLSLSRVLARLCGVRSVMIAEISWGCRGARRMRAHGLTDARPWADCCCHYKVV